MFNSTSKYKEIIAILCLITTSACAKIDLSSKDDSETAKKDAGTDTDTDTDTNTDTDTDTDTDTNTDTGSDTDTADTETGSDTGTTPDDAGADTETDTGTDTETDTETDTGTDTGTDTETDTGTDTGTDTETGEELPDLSVFSYTNTGDTDTDTSDTDPATNTWYKLGIQIHSDDAENVSLSGLILRYYYTVDTDHAAHTQTLQCFSGSCSSSDITYSFNTTSGTNADYYLELVLENITDVLKTGENWYINFGFHFDLTDPSNTYTFSNDWSYIQSSGLVENDKITLHTSSGALIWGEVPPAE